MCPQAKLAASQNSHEKNQFMGSSTLLHLTPLQAAGALSSSKCQLFTSQKKKPPNNIDCKVAMVPLVLL